MFGIQTDCHCVAKTPDRAILFIKPRLIFSFSIVLKLNKHVQCVSK